MEVLVLLSRIEQLQNQVNQMTQLMNFMMQNQDKGLNTPENHVSTTAGLACSMISTAHNFSHNAWIIDTCASNHMCCDASLMFNIQPITKSFHVALPNNHIILVTY